jgi:hypothetical protein
MSTSINDQLIAGTAPEGLIVGITLYLRGTAITSLPEGLNVGGSLYLSGTAITSLPEGLNVGGSLYLRGTAIPVIYDDLLRGYELRRVMVGAGEWFVAGCRVFRSRAAAIAHWSDPAHKRPDIAAHYVAAINATPLSEDAR